MADFDDISKPTDDEERQANVSNSVDRLMEVFSQVNDFYIECVASQIRTIGELNATSINRLTVMAEMNRNIAAIREKLRRALGYAESKLDAVLLDSFKEVSGGKAFMRYLDDSPLAQTAEKRLEQLAKSLSRQTMGTLKNLSNTSAITQGYARALDQAILATTSGLSSYQEATREIVRSLGKSGMTVKYRSGYRQRLDSAVRSNILTACNQIAQQGSDIVAEELGCDCKEISVHANPAPDHAPVQGHVLTNDNWNRMQSGEPFEDVKGRKFDGFPRAIGQWNCMHFGMAFDSRYQEPQYTPAQLAEILKQNEKGFDWRGKHYTRYQGTQLMRQLERQVRLEKDTATAARYADDEELRATCQKRIDQYGELYSSLSKASGIPKRTSRMYTEGFKRYK